MTRRLFSYSVSNSIQLWLFMLVFGLIIQVIFDSDGLCSTFSERHFCHGLILRHLNSNSLAHISAFPLSTYILCRVVFERLTIRFS